MALSEDSTTLNAYLNDFGVSCTAGSTTGLVILEQPSNILAGDLILTTDYELLTLTSNFGSLLANASIAVDSVNYTVREVRKEGDGVFCRISLQKT